MQEHETVTMCVKVAQIDRNIAPIIEWMNSFEDVYTLFSCEKFGVHGDIPTEDEDFIDIHGTNEETIFQPYVKFFSSFLDNPALYNLFEVLSIYGTIELDYDRARGIMYVVRFSSKSRMEDLIQDIGGNCDCCCESRSEDSEEQEPNAEID